MNKWLLSIGLVLTAFAAQADTADLFNTTFTNTTAFAPLTLSKNDRTVLTVERADYEATKDTNVTLRVAKVYSLMRTNVEVLPNIFQGRISCSVLHPPGTVCEWGNNWPRIEVTTISKDSIAEIDGKRFVLGSEVISRTEQTFTFKTTTEKVYINQTESPTLIKPSQSTAIGYISTTDK